MNRKQSQRTAYLASAASIAVLVAACGSTTRTVVQTVRVNRSQPVVLTEAQARAVGRLAAPPSDLDPSGPEPAIVEIHEGPGLTIDADVTYYCSENPGRTYFRIARHGNVRVLRTSAGFEYETDVRLCVPKAAR